MGSIPKRVKKLSWDDETDGFQKKVSNYLYPIIIIINGDTNTHNYELTNRYIRILRIGLSGYGTIVIKNSDSFRTEKLSHYALSKIIILGAQPRGLPG